ncbi:tRNA (guanine-N1)-methyltransferase [Robertkochia sediminum]|uniref:tRNA (guanine-N1)-methyltransferase n=1 Tax=Robertkochia sediminum TaxID=2785326 RepID=UPI00193283F2|nr:tRNA (guanine-N1)-methyltransferase [Robertkochia sediminum]MBL7473700.1 tRNA (guanine-N1)-methyltransferase [Robertkochia sediminum]
MMKTKKNLLTAFALTLVVSFSVWAQEKEEPSLNDGSIDQQFEYIMTEANNYRNYKVVKTAWLNTLKKNTLDSIARLEKELSSSIELTSTQKAEIDGLKEELAGTNEQLTNVTEEKDSISFFGAWIAKPVYKSIMWGIVGVLTLVLLFFIYRFKNANAVTQQAKKSLAELEMEYEEHRRKALEREQKARRQLQDEINKQKMQK